MRKLVGLLAVGAAAVCMVGGGFGIWYFTQPAEESIPTISASVAPAHEVKGGSVTVGDASSIKLTIDNYGAYFSKDFKLEFTSEESTEQMVTFYYTIDIPEGLPIAPIGYTSSTTTTIDSATYAEYTGILGSRHTQKDSGTNNQIVKNYEASIPLTYTENIDYDKYQCLKENFSSSTVYVTISATAEEVTD